MVLIWNGKKFVYFHLLQSQTVENTRMKLKLKLVLSEIAFEMRLFLIP